MILTMISKVLLISIIVFLVVVILVAVIVINVVCDKKNRRTDSEKLIEKTDNVVIKDNVRYNASSDNTSSLKFEDGNIILSQGTTYKASKEGPLLPGKYIIFSGNTSFQKFNVRIQGFVRSMESNTEIVVGVDDEITPVSCNIILK